MFNKVVLIGRLTKDPELRYTSTNNLPVVSFTLAVNRPYAEMQILSTVLLGENKRKIFISTLVKAVWLPLKENCKREIIWMTK